MNLIAEYRSFQAITLQLDNTTAFQTIDKSNMLAVMEKTDERLAPPSDANATCTLSPEAPESLVFGGVGGSGIVGDVLSDYCRSTIGIPSFVCRAQQIPNFVGKNTLFIAISYSGETNETLGMLDQAKRAGAQLATVCSGGSLLSLSRREKIPYVKVAEGLLPRVALPELLGATIFVMEKANIVGDSGKLLQSTGEAVTLQIGALKRSSAPEREYGETGCDGA